jgi:hypothetical protein
MVFKVAGDAYGLKHPEQNASVSLGGNNSTRRVCLHGFDNDDEDGASSMFRHSSQHGSSLRMQRSRLPNDMSHENEVMAGRSWSWASSTTMAVKIARFASA